MQQLARSHLAKQAHQSQPESWNVDGIEESTVTTKR